MNQLKFRFVYKGGFFSLYIRTCPWKIMLFYCRKRIYKSKENEYTLSQIYRFHLEFSGSEVNITYRRTIVRLLVTFMYHSERFLAFPKCKIKQIFFSLIRSRFLITTAQILLMILQITKDWTYNYLVTKYTKQSFNARGRFSAGQSCYFMAEKKSH